MTAKNASKLVGKIYKGYIYKHLVKDVSKFVMNRANDIDLSSFDKKHMLKRVGLQQRAPVATAFGSLGLLLIGGAVGAICGMLFAPKAGSELRPLIKERAMSYLGEEQSSTQAPASA